MSEKETAETAESCTNGFHALELLPPSRSQIESGWLPTRCATCGQKGFSNLWGHSRHAIGGRDYCRCIGCAAANSLPVLRQSEDHSKETVEKIMATTFDDNDGLEAWGRDYREWMRSLKIDNLVEAGELTERIYRAGHCDGTKRAGAAMRAEGGLTAEEIRVLMQGTPIECVLSVQKMTGLGPQRAKEFVARHR